MRHFYSLNLLWGQCLTVKGNVKACDTSDGSQMWVYKRLHGGTLASVDGSKCLTRKASIITVEPCNEGANAEDRKWQRLCGAWANGNGKNGRVLTFEGNENDAESKVSAKSWTGKENQLWHYDEKVQHSECSKQEHKVMSFDGSVERTVHVNAFLSMPSKEITVGVWIKGSAGSPFSYASKHHVNAFVFSDLANLKVHVKDQEIKTFVDMTSKTWVHLAVTWSSGTGELKVYRNGKKSFSANNVQTGKSITPGGCAWIGQRQKTVCKEHQAEDAYKGELIDLQVWKQVFTEEGVEKMMSHPVDQEILDKIGKMTNVKTPENQRLAFLSRQYSGEEMAQPNPPVCKMQVFEKKAPGPKLPRVSGNMRMFTGSGDVHYTNMAQESNGCKFDDQSVGEWVLSTVKTQYWAVAPLMIQFRTSPSWANNCPWCQNGMVSYIDGCAIKWKDVQASAGFGGYPRAGYTRGYTPYAAVNGVKLSGTSTKGGLTVTASSHSFTAEVNGIVLKCNKGFISLQMPNSFKGIVKGIAGTGKGRHHDWMMGPNTAAYPAARPGKQMPGLAGKCEPGYQYTIKESPFNGNRPDKALVKWFKSWQVDGNFIPSAFYYSGNTGPGSFNLDLSNGKDVKPISNTNDQPPGKKAAAIAECKLLRSTPKAREKCVFDFMIMGEDAIKASQRDRERQRAAKIKHPDIRSVRDMTRYGSDAAWSGNPSWDCGDEFRKMQILKAKLHEDLWATRKTAKRQLDAEASAACPDGLATIAETLDIHPQETKKCSAGMAALAIADEEKAEAKEGKKDEGSKKPSFWERLAEVKPACTQAYVESCVGLGCVKFSAAELGESQGELSKQSPKDNAKEVKAKAQETQFASSSAKALFMSGKSVVKAHVATKKVTTQALEVTELLQLGESEQTKSKQVADAKSAIGLQASNCVDSNEDQDLGCDKLKAACSSDTVQASCAATCGTPWAGDTDCKAFANNEQQYQCMPTSVCSLKSMSPKVPDGYKWLVLPEVKTMDPKNTYSPASGVGVAVCDAGKRVKISIKEGTKVVEEEVACGCDGGYRIITHSKSCVDALQTPKAQIARKNDTAVLKAAYENYEERAALWAQACNEIEPSASAFTAEVGDLQSVQASTKKVTFYSAPWKFRALHLQKMSRETEDQSCTAHFKWGLSVCDTGPMRDTVFFVPKRGYEIFKVGCGCQHMRVQASFNGKVVRMKDQQKETQGKCIGQFMKWNTQFYDETFSAYYDQAQKISDEIERQCARSTLEINNLAEEQTRIARLKLMVVEQNSAHLAKLSENSYSNHLNTVKETKALGKCETKTFIRSGVAAYERKTKELAKTQDAKKAAMIRNELVKLKAKLDKHEIAVGPPDR